MKKVNLLLMAQTPELEHLIAEMLGQEDGILISTRYMGQTPDLVILIGDLFQFFLESLETARQIVSEERRIICITPETDQFAQTGEVLEIVPLPKRRDLRTLDLFRKTLLIRIKSIKISGVQEFSSVAAGYRQGKKLVGIAASTGGPQTLLSILRNLPKQTCSILVVQHLTPGFSSRFVDYLKPLCEMRVKQAENGERVEDGVIYVAEDGHHLTVLQRSGTFYLCSRQEEKVNGFCPSADRLFESLAKQAGKNAMGVVLTGMGDDGARGLKCLREGGGLTVAQEEASCVIPSMPREAVGMGGVVQQLPPEGIALCIRQFSDGLDRKRI